MRSLSRDTEDEGILASINVIPFVDIVLVLLVIFMLTSAAIMRAQIKVNLPRSASAGAAVETTINLLYHKNGELELNGEEEHLRRGGALHQGAGAHQPEGAGGDLGRRGRRLRPRHRSHRHGQAQRRERLRPRCRAQGGGAGAVSGPEMA